MKKRMSSIVMALALCLTLLPATAWATAGNITENDGYYEIYDNADLKAFADLVNGGQTTINARLMNDIDLNGDSTNKWTPIGNSSNSFKGTFDGGSNTVSNLYVSVNARNTHAYAGLFGHVGSGAAR